MNSENLDLKQIVSDIVNALQHIDQKPPPPTQDAFHRSISTLSEDTIRDEIIDFLKIKRVPMYAGINKETNAEVKYPNQPKGGRGRCDLCIGNPDPFAWAIELKYIRYVGDNGKKNDFGPSKVVSPYLIHNSAIKDAIRLIKHPLAKRNAVLMWGFDYDSDVVERGHKICAQRANELKKVLIANDPENLTYYTKPTFLMFERVASDYVELGKREEKSFDGLQHPIAQKGSLAAWEILSLVDPNDH